jgi:hypothetical protein
MSDDLRYPVGRWTRPSHITAEWRERHITEIAALPVALRAAVAGLRDPQLDTPYRPGGWTVRQVVHHVADSHVNAYTRIKLALTEANPTIKPYDESRWAELPDARLPLDVSLRLVEAIHERWVALVRAIPEADFARPYQHPESGPHTVDIGLSSYAWHGRHHTAHITRLREREGW